MTDPATGPGQRTTLVRPSNPPETSLAAICALTGAAVTGFDSAAQHLVTGVALRAQDIVAGDLFAALPGARAHGAQFGAEAVENGATAILTDGAGAELVASLGVPVLVHESPRSVLGEVSATIFGHPSRKLTLVGITGTSGKTTTAYLAEAGLLAAGRKVGLIGTVETRINAKRIPSALTTPEAPQLQALFAAMVEEGIDTVVMEVSSHALALGRVDGCQFAVGAFTNLSQDHLDFHSGLEDYFLTKAKLFTEGSAVRAARAVVCVDDEWGRRLAGMVVGEGLVTVATGDREATWRAGAPSVEPGGTQRFGVTGPEGSRYAVELRLPGQYNVANALLALAVIAASGADLDQAIEGIGRVQVPGRLERVDRGQPFLAVVDYAHKPGAVEAVIATLRGQATGRLAVVLGAGGDRDTGKRALMGAAGAAGGDLLVVTDDNPRSEDAATIRAEVLAGAHSVPEEQRGQVVEVGDRAKAIAAAVDWIITHGIGDDVVLVAGKGHETGQEVAGVKHPFDDREVLAQVIGASLGAPESRVSQ